MTNEVVFSTLKDAQGQQAKDHAALIAEATARCTCKGAGKCQHCHYIEDTTAWATPVERKDGKWAYRCKGTVDYTKVAKASVEVYDRANYPDPEEE